MAAPSILSYGSNTLDSLTSRCRPKVKIDLVGQKQGFVSSYTTGDRIDGNTLITVDHDTSFDEIEISFEGGFVFLCLNSLAAV